MPAIPWTNGWVSPSRRSGHWEQNISASAGNQTKTPRSSSTYNIEVSFHITHAPAPTQQSTNSAQHKQSLPPNFIFKNVWTNVITSQFMSHMLLCGSSEQDVVYCSDPLQPLHIWHTSLLCSPTPPHPLQTENNSHRIASNGQLTITATMNGACHATSVR
jgi:hypothetical protein